MFILMDDEDRENEGDLVIAADYVTKDAINFAITHARGLLCLTIDHTIADRLRLRLQDRSNTDQDGTAFTTSIDARHGITTGISCKDRVTTIKTAINSNSTYDDISTPGHIFPIVGHRGGLAARNGHTEASLELCALAGLTKAAVICEILNEHGDPSGLDDITKFAAQYNISISSIKLLEEYINDQIQ